ncbi:MAG TPA: hypothetical protein VIQ31_15260 [Phormidium sp.]
MNKCIGYLVFLVLVGTSGAIAAPSFAQTVIQSDTQDANNINQLFSEQIPASAASVQSVADSALNSTNSDRVVVSEAGNKASDSSSSVAVSSVKPSQREPLPSRIFDTPSMQQ